MKQFSGAESEQDGCQQIRCRPDQLIAKPRNNCAYGSDEILRGMIRWRNLTEPHPGWHVFRRVGNQREKEQCADEKQNESEDLVPSIVSVRAGHRI